MLTLVETDLSTPTLDALLCCRGSLAAIADCALGGERRAAYLDADAVYAAAEWALDHIGCSDDGVLLARLGMAFGVTPAAYIGLDNPVLAHAFNVACLAAERSAGKEPRPRSEEAVRFTVPDPNGDR